LFLSLYSKKPANGTALAQELLTANTSNEMFVAAQKSMDRNNDIKTYGSRLANVPAEERKLILAGSNIFTSLCVTCHGPGGKGLEVAGTSSLAAPSIINSKRINGDKATLVKILLHGLSGPVDEKEYPSVMPSLGANSDEWVASVVNYVRYELGNASRRFRRPTDTISPYVSLAEVAAVRAQNASRVTPWTIAELEGAAQTATADVTTNNSAATTTSTKSSSNKAGTSKKTVAKTTTSKKTSFADVQSLLQKNTCLTCHNPNTKVIGPSYKEIAKRKYSVAQIVQLIQKPNPEHWPGYATRMPPMAHVPKTELTKIAQWIKSLEKAK
jgi:mono/diheme cytochrome c family protein